MLIKTPISLVRKLWLPRIVQVTRVPLPSGAKTKSVVLLEANGSTKSSFMSMRSGRDSVTT